MLSACSSQAPDESNAVQQYFASLQSATSTVEIVSDLGGATLTYKVEYVYHKEEGDTFVITEPEVLAGISATIAGENAASLTLQYDGTELDAPGPERPGLTPADAITHILCDLRDASPSKTWSERIDGQELSVLEYVHEEEDEPITRQVWLNEKTPIYAEVFLDGNRVLTCTFENWSENKKPE